MFNISPIPHLEKRQLIGRPLLVASAPKPPSLMPITVCSPVRFAQIAALPRIVVLLKQASPDAVSISRFVVTHGSHPGVPSSVWTASKADGALIPAKVGAPLASASLCSRTRRARRPISISSRYSSCRLHRASSGVTLGAKPVAVSPIGRSPCLDVRGFGFVHRFQQAAPLQLTTHDKTYLVSRVAQFRRS
jgi:hypothetical protein